MTHLAALETSARISAEFRVAPTATGQFYTYLVAHEKAFVILGNTFLSSFATLKFLYAEFDKGPEQNRKRLRTTKP